MSRFSNSNFNQIGSLSGNINSLTLNAMYPPAPLVAAKGDGTTDDTTALQALINYAISTRSALYLPEGNYKITSTLTISASIRIFGDKGKQYGKCAAIEYYGTGIAMDCDTSGTWGVMIENIVIFRKNWTLDSEGNYGLHGTGLRMVKASEAQLLNVTIQGFEYGLECANTNITNFVGCWFANNKNSVWLADKTHDNLSYGGCVMLNFYYCNFWQADKHVIFGGENIFFEGCHIELAYAASFYFDGDHSSQMLNLGISNCNIRNTPVNARIMKIQQGATDVAILNNINFKNCLCRTASTSTYAIESLLNGSNTNRQAIFNLENTTFNGVTTSAINANSRDTSVFTDGYIRVTANYDGSGSVMPLVSGTINLTGFENKQSYTQVHGGMVFDGLPLLAPTNGGLYFDGTVFKMADGSTTKTLSTFVSVPASVSSAGNPGEWSSNGSYLYVCYFPNAWARVAIAAW